MERINSSGRPKIGHKKAQITFIPSDPSKPQIVYPNIVQACLAHYEPNHTTGYPQEITQAIIDKWKAIQFNRIKERIQLLINKVLVLRPEVDKRTEPVIFENKQFSIVKVANARPRPL